jgi:hypothetical protein
MKPEPNNDIDLLLRQLSRRNGVPVSENDEQHLDADELNSYAANALPAAARARYTEHLADCSSCRKLVVQLSAAQGPVPVQQTASVVAPSGLKTFLASLFSPMVLRYAAPALGLIVIAAVGLLVFRPEQRDANIAQLREAETKPATAVAGPSQEPTASPSMLYDSPSETTPRREAPQTGPVVAPVTKEGRGQVAGEPADQPADAAGNAAAPPAAPKVEAVQNEPPPAKSEESQAEKKEKPAEDKAVNVTATGGAIKRDYNQNDSLGVVSVAPGATTRQDVQVRSAERAAKPMAGAGTGSLKRAPADKAEKDDERAAETRSVAGRQFRKSAGVWIDTDYDSSKSITSVARGSEQYRALIADEPSIKTIADELDGQIVVVWKGRTYRIR